MKIIELLGNKYALWIIIILGAAGAFKINSCTKSDYETQLAIYTRQLNGQLSDTERELQAANNALGVSSSKLLSQEELNAQLAKDRDALDAKFKEYIKKYELEIASRDETIARLNQQLSGGNSGTTILGCDALVEQIKTCTISYYWSDTLGRFKLTDPSIFVQNDESFTSEQYFAITGEIWRQKNGSLETHRIILQEVTNLGDGEYQDVPSGKAEIVSSEFFYTN